MIVVVDQTPPGIAMPFPQQGVDSTRDQVRITWTVTDENLGARPIQLSYSSSSNGPWQTIHDRLENLGLYNWTLAPTVPARIYIRLTARDAAGNISHHVTPQPLILDLAKPKAKLVDVEASSRR